MRTELYQRQQTLGLRIPEAVHVVGCGGVGTWVAIYLAMSGVKQLYLYDSDVLELSNLNRMPYTKSQVGIPKVIALRSQIGAIRPDCEVWMHPSVAFPVGFEPDCPVVDCTDDLSMQRRIYSYCKEQGIEYIRAGYDGLHITVSSSVPEWGQEQRRGYTQDPSWVVPAAIVAALAVAKLLKYPQLEVSSDVGDV